MRELKFKAYWKDENTGEVTAEITEIRVDSRSFCGRSQQSNYRDLIGFVQFTGLQDKKGMEIYEGDILQAGKWETWKSEVKAIPGTFIASIPETFRGVSLMERVQPLASFCFDHYQWFVIGNIYQNPELLTGKEAGKV